MNNEKLFTRFLSVLLAVVLFVGTLPTFPQTGNAVPNQSDEEYFETSMYPSMSSPSIDDAEAGVTYVEGEVLVVFSEEKTTEDASQILGRVESIDEQSLEEEKRISEDTFVAVVGEGETVSQAIEELSQDPEIVHVQPNYLYELVDEVDVSPLIDLEAISINDEFSSMLWALEAMNIYSAWSLIKTNKAVSVAVIDTGVNTAHYDLEKTVIRGTYYDATKTGQRDDVHGHGTHVAGIVGAEVNNTIGVAGSSYNAGIIPICAGAYVPVEGTSVQRFDITSEWLCSAYEYLFSTGSSGKTLAEEHNLKVINMSLGSNIYDFILERHIDNAYQKGVLTVCAAGNEETSIPSYPAAFKNCISVSALANAFPSPVFDSSYSNYGSTIDVSAPGTDIVSTSRNGNDAYEVFSGTSMASPYVAGVAALVYAANPEATVQEVRNALEKTAIDLGGSGWDAYYGHGMVDAAAAVIEVSSTSISYSGDVKVGYPVQCTVISTLAELVDWKWSIVAGIGTMGSSGVLTSYEVGDVTVRATSAVDERVYAEVTISIVGPVEIVLSESTFVYNGVAQIPDVEVYYEGERVTDDNLYSFSVEGDSKNVGSAEVVVTCDSSLWERPIKKSFTIEPCPIASGSVQIQDIPEQEYTGDVVVPLNTIVEFIDASGQKHVLNREVDYSLSYEEGIDAINPSDSVLLDFNGRGNFEGTVSKGFVIRGVAITYGMHVQEIGWQPSVNNGKVGGTFGQSLRVEAIKINMINNTGIAGGVEYRAHIQDVGWETVPAKVETNGDSGVLSEGSISGTSGRSLRLESVSLNLTGDLESKYNIYYRVHAQHVGWMGWAKNGENAGTAGLGYRLEAIQIYLVDSEKGAPDDNFGEISIASPELARSIDAKNIVGDISYDAGIHIQNIGDVLYSDVNGVRTMGTTGNGLRLEALSIHLKDVPYAGGLEYSTHIQDIGWQEACSGGEVSGTTGENRRLEAVTVSLTDEMRQNYDIYYRTHVQGFGWTDWAKNGERCGSAGYSYRMEAIQIVITKKGSVAPGISGSCYYAA